MRSFIAVSLTLLLLCGCTQLTLDWAKLSPRDEAAVPDLAQDAALIREDAKLWPDIRLHYLSLLEKEVYGRLPDSGSIEVLSTKVLDQNAFGDRAVLEEYLLRIRQSFGDVEVASQEFRLELLTPHNKFPSPVIILQTFCSRSSTLPHPLVEGRSDKENGEMDGLFGSFAKMVFGRHICTPPIEQLIDQGFALAVIQPSEFVADSPQQGLATLAELSIGYKDNDTRWGAIAAWAWQITKIVDLLEMDKRIDHENIVVWGHSRFAKSSLLAMAIDQRINGAVAHQSGTGGASLNRNKPGESIGSITKSYPHWFAMKYRSFADETASMTSDQHMLLAALAPRPVLLGNARRDVWSDPNGAFRAAMGADLIYEALGVQGLKQDRLNEFIPESEISYWIRPGTHGVVKEDWEAFFDFLTAHFTPDPYVSNSQP